MKIRLLPFADRARFSIWTLAAFTLLLGLAAPQVCQAQPATDKATSQQLMQRYQRAVTMYNTGQYDKAIEEFQGLYELKPQPILLFNLAQAHRKAGHKAQALDLYERYLREAPNSELSAETTGYVSELKKQIEEDKQAEKAAAEKAAAEKAASEKAAAEWKKKYGPTRPLNLAKWGAVGLGVALVVTGAVLIGVDGQPVCSADMPQMTGQKLCPNELDTKIAGIGVLAGGVAALGGAAGLFVLDHRSMREAQSKAPLVAFNVRF
jgi:tetratricopeptide (TPR) repeat protein